MLIILAETKGKISSTGSNLSDRMEDKLTGDFFGALRYIPFTKAMMPILLKTNILNNQSIELERILESLDVQFWNEHIEFWPYHILGELDVLLSFDNINIGIEVKYLSGLSSDDDVLNHDHLEKERSINQLARESEIIKQMQTDDQETMLIYIAPESSGYLTAKEVIQRNILVNGVAFGYLSWETIYENVEELMTSSSLNNYEKLVLEDIKTLLKKKGFERFRSFKINMETIDKNNYYYFKDKVLFNFNYNKDVFKGGVYEFTR